MKKAAVVAACTLLFVAVAGLAETKSPPPLNAQALAAILGQSAVQGSCPTPQNEVLFAARRPGMAKACSATANCWDGSTRSCSFTGAGGTCTATDSNCSAGQRGSVNCNGTVTSCPVCPCGTPACCRCESTGGCFDCCRCAGGTVRGCSEECSGGF